MPNMSSHMSVAKRVSEQLNIKDDNFIIGNLIPDLENNKIKSHYKIQGKKYMIPDTEGVKNKLDLHDNKNLGIYTHLLLDKYYLEDYLYVKYPKINVFFDNIIYKDYDILNNSIVRHFDLDIDYIKEVLLKIENENNQIKLLRNIDCLYLNEKGNTTYLDEEEFINFLEEVSLKIIDDVKSIIND